MPYRERMIDPLCIQPIYVDGVGSVEVKSGELVEITYFVANREPSTGETTRMVALKIIMPVSGLIGDALLNWAKAPMN